MIIGISGKKQSGKDLAAKIIMYFESHAFEKWSFEKYLEHLNQGHIGTFGYGYKSKFQIVKFADKLKQIVCLLTGCTLKDLEDEIFKNSILPKEWSTEEKGIIFTPTYRQSLQFIGTNMFRDMFHPNTWVNATMSEYKCLYEDDFGKYYPDWIIPDVRFPNEVSAIKEKNGILIRISSTRSKEDNHESETALDNYSDWDYLIENNGSIEDFLEKIKLICIKEDII